MTDARILFYLLNELSTDEKEGFEERLARDPEFAERVAMIESELLDAYVSDELSSDQRARLEEHCLTSDGKKSNLAFAEALKRNLNKRVLEG
jgi:anti-sigma factor RsiW